MSDLDLERILELREVVRWSSDPNAFAFLRGMEEARWAIVEAEGVPGAVVGMVGAIPLGKIGILCHLAVRHDYRKMGLGVRLSSWAVSYLRSRGAEVVRLDATHRAEALYRSLGFELTSRRVTYRLEGATLKARVRDARSRSPRSSESALSITPLAFGDLPELYGVDR